MASARNAMNAPRIRYCLQCSRRKLRPVLLSSFSMHCLPSSTRLPGNVRLVVPLHSGPFFFFASLLDNSFRNDSLSSRNTSHFFFRMTNGGKGRNTEIGCLNLNTTSEGLISPGGGIVGSRLPASLMRDMKKLSSTRTSGWYIGR